jgi:integrase
MATAAKVTLNHYFPRFIPRAFNRMILPKAGIHDSRKTWHSFRHTFKTGLARAGVPRSMQDDLCGHTDSSAGAGYVHGESVEAMKEATEKLRFDGFALAA